MSAVGAWAVAALLALNAGAAAAQGDATLALKPCRLKGVSTEARCGVLQRPLDPAKPQGVQIALHVAVLPALARNKLPDPVFFFAGGPGQSAIALAGRVQGLMGRFLTRRDVVLIDQRGTGQSAPLACDDHTPALRPLREQIDPARETARIQACLTRLQSLPHGDLRRYTTAIAMADAEAVRQALGLGPVNVVGGSYGTRAVLEFLRAYPASVRRAVIDGVAPPDMVLPASFSIDGQAALDAVFAACDKEAACARRYPALRADWQALLNSLPRDITVSHPLTGLPERFTLRRDTLLHSVRSPLYVPAFAAALPTAIHTAATTGRFEGLLGLGGALGSGKGSKLAMGMHFSVVCAEDVPRLYLLKTEAGTDFGNSDATLYRTVCKTWPRGEVPPAFYTIPPATSPVLLLSGGADPATPPRHGERMAKALGQQAQHIVVPEAGHGVMGIGCMRDVIFRFVDAKTDAQALPQDASCATKIPRPPAFVTPQVQP